MSKENPRTIIDPPRWSIALARLGVLAILAFYFFVIYCIARGLIPEFGASTQTVIKASLRTAVMGSLVIWLVLLIELPEKIYGHVLPMRRHARNRCHSCGHPFASKSSNCCTECGTQFDCVPEKYSLSWRTGRRFFAILLMAMAIGICIGEWSTTSDEIRMERAVMPFTTPNFNQPPTFQLQGNTNLVKQFRRRWPAGFCVVEWHESTGFMSFPLHYQE